MALMKAVQVNSTGSDFELVHKEIPSPKENEVLIKVEACGVCHGGCACKGMATFQDCNIPGYLDMRLWG